MRDAPQHFVSPEELKVIKAIVVDPPAQIVMARQKENGWMVTQGDEDALRQFRNTAYYKICIPRDTDSWTDMHLSHIGVALQKPVLYFALRPEWAEIHYR